MIKYLAATLFILRAREWEKGRVRKHFEDAPLYDLLCILHQYWYFNQTLINAWEKIVII